MKNIFSLLVTLSLSLPAFAGDSVAIGTVPSVSPRIVAEGAACSGVGTEAITSTGLPLSCQSGRWQGIDGEPVIYSSGLKMGGSGTINLGPHKFCSLGTYRSDSNDDGLCNVYKSGDNWYFSRSQQSYVGCGAICFK